MLTAGDGAGMGRLRLSGLRSTRNREAQHHRLPWRVVTGHL